jgi:hypothetical protein
MWIEIITLIIVGIILGYYIGYQISYHYNSDKTIRKDKVIKILYRQCARYSVSSVQDTNPVVATIHSNYAAAYLFAMEDVFTADELSKVTGINYQDFKDGIIKNQDLANELLMKACPDFSKVIEGSSLLISKVAGESLK